MAKRLQRPQNKRRSAAVIAVAVAVALASVAVAVMLRRAEVQSYFTPAVVTCAVHEKVNGAEVTGSAASGSVKSDITAENTGSTTVFLRLLGGRGGKDHRNALHSPADHAAAELAGRRRRAVLLCAARGAETEHHGAL